MDGVIAEKYAQVLLVAGVDLKPGQNLYIHAPVEAAALVRALTKHAYALGAKYVKPLFYDVMQDELRARYAAEEDLSYMPQWEQDYLEQLSAQDCAYLKLACVHNVDQSAVSADRLAAVTRANMQQLAGYRKNMDAWRISWTSAIFPTQEWAELAYPELESAQAMDALMQDFIRINRLDEDDPAACWKTYRDTLGSLCKRLNELDIVSLRFDSPTVALDVNLAENGNWVGGAVSTADHRNRFMGNLPTAEVFHVPHKYGVNGRVRATLPLNYNGSVIEDIDLRFENGRVVEYSASSGYATLKHILETDPGAMHLGEVALVPASSPIGRCKRVFNTTLYDENASCHLALGNYCSMCTGSVSGLDDAEVEARGINQSRMHVDFMFGSDMLQVRAVCRDGRQVTLMRGGEWTDEF